MHSVTSPFTISSFVYDKTISFSWIVKCIRGTSHPLDRRQPWANLGSDRIESIGGQNFKTFVWHVELTVLAQMLSRIRCDLDDVVQEDISAAKKNILAGDSRRTPWKNTTNENSRKRTRNWHHKKIIYLNLFIRSIWTKNAKLNFVLYSPKAEFVDFSITLWKPAFQKVCLGFD